MKLKQSGIMAGANIGRLIGNATVTTQSNASGRWRPGMEQFINAIKLKSKGDRMLLCLPQGLLLPEVLRQKPASILQKRLKNRDTHCVQCKKPDSRKYVCSKTLAVTCSYECYKAVQAKA